MRAVEPATAGQAIGRVLVELATELRVQLVGIPDDADDAVHQARIRVRRLRSVLTSFKRLFDREATAPMRTALRDLGGALGAARDAEVRSSSIEALLAESRAAEDTMADDAATTDALVARSRTDVHVAHDELLHLLGSPEHGRFLAELDAFAVAPPLRGRASKPAKPVFMAAIENAVGRVERAAREVSSRDLDALHELRKSARRLRYAADAASTEPAPVLGRKAQRLSAAGEAVQNILGDHRDGILLAAYLRESAGRGELGWAAATRVEELAARCEDAAASVLDGLDDALDGIRDPYS